MVESDCGGKGDQGGPLRGGVLRTDEVSQGDVWGSASSHPDPEAVVWPTPEAALSLLLELPRG